jgi:hypothetical protein
MEGGQELNLLSIPPMNLFKIVFHRPDTTITAGTHLGESVGGSVKVGKMSDLER